MDDLDKIIAESQTAEGQAKTKAFIHRHGGVVYEAAPQDPDDIIIEVAPDGTRRRGRLVNGRFTPLAES